LHAQRYTPKMHIKLPLKTTILAAAGFSFALSAFAQWQWLDKDGRKVFSDRSPPAEVHEKDILKRPRGSVRPAVSVEAETAASVSTKAAGAAPPALAKSASPKLSGKDAELEAKKKKAEEEDAAKKKAEEEKVASINAENCARAKNGMATLQSGVRMASVNAKGEREVFDDERRAVEVKHTQDVMNSSCK
jgi:Domain of unknown function (DUF4124)